MLEQILKGGSMMWPLMALSLWALAVVFDRWMAFKANRKIDTRAMRSKILTRLRAGDAESAIAECAASGGPIAAVLLVGLRSYVQLRDRNENAETMRMVVGQVMQDYAAQAMSVVNKRLDSLTTIGTAAPLFGMTGTVTGMIASFAGMAEAGSTGGGGGAVAAGIAEALITTAAGLLIALMAVLPQSVFNRWSDEIELEIEEAGAEVLEFILTRHHVSNQ
jgi:biopolymer transport protein ExbB